MSFRKDLIKWEKFCAKRDRKHAKQEFKREEIVRERDAAFNLERGEKLMTLAPPLVAELCKILFKPSEASYAAPVSVGSPAVVAGIATPRLTLTYAEGKDLYAALCDVTGQTRGDVLLNVLLTHGIVINPPGTDEVPSPAPESDKKPIAQA